MSIESGTHILQQLIDSSYEQQISSHIVSNHQGTICQFENILNYIDVTHSIPIIPISNHIFVTYQTTKQSISSINIHSQQFAIKKMYNCRNFLFLDISPFEVQKYFGIRICEGDCITLQNANYQIYNGKIQLKGFWFEQDNFDLNPETIDQFNCTVPKIEGVLKLENENIGVEGVNVMKTKQWLHLTVLNLWWNKIEAEGALQLSSICFPSLNVLDLRKNFIGDQGFSYLCGKKWSVIELILSDNNLTHVNQMKQENFTNLLTFDLQNNKIGDNKFFQLPPQLIKLNLSNNILKGKHLNCLNLAHLKHLFLSSNKITSCQSLAMCDLASLQFLSLYDNYITNIGWIRKISFCPMEIWIHKNPMRISQTIDCSNFLALNSLRLQFSPNNCVFFEDLSWMVKHCPNIVKLNAASKQRIPQPKVAQMFFKMHGSQLDFRMH